MRSSGFTLIQLMVVLAVAGIISAVVIKQAQQDLQREFLSTVPGKVEQLHTAVSSYYDANCHSGTVAPPTINALISNGYLSSANVIKLPRGAIFDSITIESVSGKTVFSYVITFSNHIDALAVSAMQRMSIAMGNDVVWRFSGNASNSNSATEAIEYLQAFGVNHC